MFGWTYPPYTIPPAAGKNPFVKSDILHASVGAHCYVFYPIRLKFIRFSE